MVTKNYSWADGAILDDHTKRKHKILREYFFEYITVRCQNPQQSLFRLAVVDGFAGGGRYKCGSAGSPLIFVEELQKSLEAVNIRRMGQGLGEVEIACLLIFNDADPTVVELLREACAPLLAAVSDTCPKLHLEVQYLSDSFEASYPAIKTLISGGRYKSVLYNLDQCGHAQVHRDTVLDIMRSAPSVEIFYTFAVQTLLTFLSRTNPSLLESQLQHLGISAKDLGSVEQITSNNEWLGAAERLVFESFKGCAGYVSPFSINNPDGWRYWLIHFANKYRARQVYNDILHSNATSQAHFGRSGLNMLAYDQGDHGGFLYLFDQAGRISAKAQLAEDIPRLVSESGDAMAVGEFYETIYNMTPAHMDDINLATIENDDLQVVTPTGGERRKANTITVTDTIRLKNQRSFFPMFFGATGRNTKK